MSKKKFIWHHCHTCQKPHYNNEWHKCPECRKREFDNDRHAGCDYGSDDYIAEMHHETDIPDEEDDE